MLQYYQVLCIFKHKLEAEEMRMSIVENFANFRTVSNTCLTISKYPFDFLGSSII